MSRRICSGFVAAVLIATNPPSAEAAGTWTSIDGATIEADFIRVTSQNVVILKLPSGDEQHVPLDQLSPGDQSRIRRITTPQFPPPPAYPAVSNFSAGAVPLDQLKSDPDPDQPPLPAVLAAKIRAAVAAKTAIEVGSKEGKSQFEFFRDLPADGGVLIGFDVSISPVLNARDTSPVIQGLYPLFLTSKGKVNGKRHGYYVERRVHVEARPGYAVGKIEMCGGLRIKAFKLTYMKLTPRGLDSRMSYQSVVYGSPSTSLLPTVGDGSPIIGIHGECGRSTAIYTLGVVTLPTGP